MVTGTEPLPQPAQAIDAERSVVGALLHSATAIRDVRTILTGKEFYQPRHELIWDAVCDLADDGKLIDPLVVVNELTRREQLNKVGGAAYLFDVYHGVATVINAGYHAEMVRDAHRHREMVMATERALQQLRQAGTLDSALDTIARLNLQTELLLKAKGLDEPIDRLCSWDDFVNQEDTPRDWIVDNLFEVGDVWMILAPGGAGKSWLSRQICMSIAAGVHPFHPRRLITPQRTLLIDLEVADSMLRQQSRDPLNAVHSLGEFTGERGFVWRRQEGLNLRDREDALLLERVIDEVKPRFVALGSLYKAYQKGNSDWDTASEETRAVLDRIRTRYNVCWWLEHHMSREAGSLPSGKPYGGSSWDKWPTHGRMLNKIKGTKSPLYEFSSTWRGDRDVREVPVGLQRGGRLPWTATFDEAEWDQLVDTAKS